jgi:uncharacterized protein (TIGR02444 family)
MYTDLWSFAVALYSRPGVEQACLDLQADGADVCLLLCGAWLGQRGVALTVDRVEQLQKIAGPWQAEVVQPLRQLRQQWREAALQDSDLDSMREQVKELELTAERQLLIRLEGLSREWPEGKAELVSQWLQRLMPLGQSLHHDALQVLRVAVSRA